MKIFFTLLAASLFTITHSQTTSLSGRTTGRLPYLNYGLGEDRLGGAKMTYLDTGIIVKVIDSSNNDYKVQLSQNHIAYIAKQNWKSDAVIRPLPLYLTSSWRVWGDDRYDYVSIALPERLPYKTVQQIDPSRIVIDIYGVTSNTNWVTQLNTVKEIKNVWYEQPEDDVFRVYIELKHPQHWGYLTYYKNNTLQIKVKRQPTSLKPKHILYQTAINMAV